MLGMEENDIFFFSSLILRRTGYTVRTRLVQIVKNCFKKPHKSEIHLRP